MFSVNLLSKNNSSGMATMLPSAYRNSFMSQQFGFSLDQTSVPDESLLSNQENTLLGQVPIDGLNCRVLSEKLPEQGFPMDRNAFLESEGRHQDGGSDGFSSQKTSKFGLCQSAGSLDPLEQRILYDTDDNIWESSFDSSSKISAGGCESTVEHASPVDALSSLQSGSWSALMQSAAGKTCSTDVGIKEEWSGLNLLNPEQLIDTQSTNPTSIVKLHNAWVDRNTQNLPSSSLDRDCRIQNYNLNYSLPSSLQLYHQFLKQKEGYQWEATDAIMQQSHRTMHQLVDYNSQEKLTAAGNQLTHASFSVPNVSLSQQRASSSNDFHLSGDSCTNDIQPVSNFSGNESSGTLWLQGNESPHADSIQKPYDQVNQLNMHRCSVAHDVTPGNIAMTTLLGIPFNHQGEGMTAPSDISLELLNKDGISNDQTSLIQLNTVPRELLLSQWSVEAFAKSCNASPTSPNSSFRPVPINSQNAIPNSFFPSTGNSSSITLSGHIMNDSISTNVMTTTGAPHMLLNRKSFQHEYSIQESCATSGKTEHNNAKQLEKGSLHDQEFLRKHHSETGTIAPVSFMTYTDQQPSNQGGWTDQGMPFSARDTGAPGHPFTKSDSILHQMHSSSYDETNGWKNFLPKYDSVNYQQSVVSARQLSMSGQQSGVSVRKGDPYAVSQPAAFWARESSERILMEEARRDQLGSSLSTSYHLNHQEFGVLGQNDTVDHSIGGKEASNITYQSQISMPMTPSWLKDYETLNNGQETRLIVQLNLDSCSEGSSLWPSMLATSAADKQVKPPYMLPIDVDYQTFDVSVTKKRKLLAMDMLPWHKEVKHETSRLLGVRDAVVAWAQGTGGRSEEITNEDGVVKELHPLIRAKRRLTCTTQLMQQVLPSAPAAILCSDVSSNLDCVAYFTARLTLGDACSITGQLTSNTNEMSPDKPQTSKETNASKFSNAVQCFNNQVKKLQNDILRLENSFTHANNKVEGQELDKLSILNRFAKFYIKARLNRVDSASSSGTSTSHRINPQRYVIAVPMPHILPEGMNCLSL